MLNSYYNGKYCALEELTLPALDRAVYFGDGVYEATQFVGGRPVALGDHLARFERSLAFLKILPGFTFAELEIVVDTLCANVGGDGIVYWQTSRGTAPRSHTFPSDAAPNLLAWAKTKPQPDVTLPLKLITQPDIRYKMCNVKTLNLVPNVMAAQAAKDAGCDEAVFVRDGFVTEGAHTNVHIIKEGKLITHPNGPLILPGTVRGQLIDICHRLGVEVIERPFTPSEMYAADEILDTSATSYIRYADEIDGHKVGGKARELVAKLQAAYRDFVAESIAR